MKPIKKVLLIDDDAIQLAIVSAWLQHDGLEVIPRDTPIGTYQAFLRHRPDLVLLDVQMPAMAGPSLATLLSREAAAQQVGIIFYSGQSGEALRGLPQGPPVLGAIHKTADGQHFLAQLHRLVSTGRRRGPGKALVVDDDPVQLAIVRAWLEAEGLSVVSHASSIGVTAIVNRERPEVALVDVEMPVLSGPALVQTLEKNVKYELAIIFYSGKDAAELDGLVRGHRLVRGAIRKGSDPARFMAEFKRLTESVFQGVC